MSVSEYRGPGRVVSGGQTGVDRAALDVAMALKLDCGGWCPRGRLAEDGPIAPDYPLRETASARYRVRTERNVLDSDATLILARGPLSGGTALTARLARRHGRPLLVVTLGSDDPALVQSWLRRHRVDCLNVAGPRASNDPEIYPQARTLLLRVLTDAGRGGPP